jgi:hypothetical protein
VIETTDAIRNRVWRAAPEPVGLDATADVRALRDEDARLADSAAAARSGAGNADSDAAAPRC